MTRTIHEHVVGNELGIVLIGRNHICLHSLKVCLVSYCSYDVVSLKAVNLNNWNMESVENILDDRYRHFNVFRSFLTLCLIGRKSLMTEGLAVVEGYGKMCWFLFRKNLVKSVTEAHDCACVHTL